MSEKFNSYEYIAVVAPGSILVTGLAALYCYNGQKLTKDEFGVGDLGIFLILAFVFGHLIQAVGNWIEWIFWKINRGMPTNWVIQPNRSLLSRSQIERLKDLIQHDFNQDLLTVSEKEWFSITREINSKIKVEGCAERLDSFNRAYGLLRGIAAAFLILGTLIVVKDWAQWKIAVMMFIFSSFGLSRMHRFGVHYGRELFVSYLTLKR